MCRSRKRATALSSIGVQGSLERSVQRKKWVPPPRTTPLSHLQAFLDTTRGQITIGEIPPIRRAALAAEGKKARVALVGRDGETIAELLGRLDATVGKAMAENITVDEVLPEIKRRRAR